MRNIYFHKNSNYYITIYHYSLSQKIKEIKFNRRCSKHIILYYTKKMHIELQFDLNFLYIHIFFYNIYIKNILKIDRFIYVKIFYKN